MNSYEKRYKDVMQNFSTRNYLKKALEDFNNRDPVDALKEASLLLELMELRVNEER